MAQLSATVVAGDHGLKGTPFSPARGIGSPLAVGLVVRRGSTRGRACRRPRASCWRGGLLINRLYVLVGAVATISITALRSLRLLWRGSSCRSSVPGDRGPRDPGGGWRHGSSAWFRFFVAVAALPSPTSCARCRLLQGSAPRARVPVAMHRLESVSCCSSLRARCPPLAQFGVFALGACTAVWVLPVSCRTEHSYRQVCSDSGRLSRWPTPKVGLAVMIPLILQRAHGVVRGITPPGGSPSALT